MEGDEDGVMREEAFAAVVVTESWGPSLCFACMKQPGTFQCNACDSAWYCSQECQESDWVTKQHSIECGVFKRVSDRSQEEYSEIKESPDLRLAFRVWSRFMIERERIESRGDGDGGGSESSSSADHPLQPLLNSIRGVEDVITGFYPKLQNLKRLFLSEEASNEENKILIDIVVAVHLNFRKILHYRVHDVPEVVGIALYLRNSQYPHSCTPNLLSWCEGSVLRTSSIRKTTNSNDTSEKTENTVCLLDEQDPNLMLTPERGQRLKSRFGLTCSCQLCSSPGLDEIKMNALKTECQKCHEALVPRLTSLQPIMGMNIPVGLFCHVCQGIQAKIGAEEFAVIARVVTTAVDVDPMSPRTRCIAPSTHFSVVAERVIDASAVLHPVKNLLLYRLREAVFASLEPLWATAGTASVMAGYEAGVAMYATMAHYSSHSVAKPLLCAKLGRMAKASNLTKDALKWYRLAVTHFEELIGKDQEVSRKICQIIQELEGTVSQDEIQDS